MAKYKLYYQGPDGEIRISKTGIPTAEDKTLSEAVADDIIAEGLIPGGKGEKGDKGDKGDRGEQGPVGPQGPQGIQGPKGDKGDIGAQGPQGAQGPKGDKGDAGSVGPQGPKGEDGKDFEAPVFPVTNFTYDSRYSFSFNVTSEVLAQLKTCEERTIILDKTINDLETWSEHRYYTFQLVRTSIRTNNFSRNYICITDDYGYDDNKILLMLSISDWSTTALQGQTYYIPDKYITSVNPDRFTVSDGYLDMPTFEINQDASWTPIVPTFEMLQMFEAFKTEYPWLNIDEINTIEVTNSDNTNGNLASNYIYDPTLPDNIPIKAGFSVVDGGALSGGFYLVGSYVYVYSNYNIIRVKLNFSQSGGGTIDAEPIVSINMTNMDCTGTDGGEIRIIRDLQFFCTKERWDEFVSLASSTMSVDVTYENFDTVFKSLSIEHQATAIGYLLMDYYSGKVLPEAYLQNNQSAGGIAEKDKYGIASISTLTDPQTNLEFVWGCSFRGATVTSNPQNTESGVIPAPDMVSTNYYTANTVITVEEIAGPVIGKDGESSSSGGLDVLDFYTSIGGTSGVISIGCLSGELESDKTIINNSIETVNAQTGLNIPLMTDVNSLSSILDYVNANIQAGDMYDAAMTMFFSWLVGHVVTARVHASLYMTNASLDATIMARQDPQDNFYNISVAMGDDYWLNVSSSGYGTGTATGKDSAGKDITLDVTVDNIDVQGETSFSAYSSLPVARSGQNQTFSKLVVRHGSGSGGGSKPESTFDYLQIGFNSNDHIMLTFDKKMTRADDIPASVNELINSLNQMGNLDIPAYSDLEDLRDIASYLNGLDTQTYAQIKVIFWASLFSLFPYLALNAKGYKNRTLVPVWITGVADTDNQDFSYTVKFMDMSGQLETVADEQTVFNFNIWVDDMD